MDKEVKCPQCKNIGRAYLRDYRYWFECLHCGLSKYLKTLNTK